MKNKIAFVLHRYGADVSGGAEYTTRELAERFCDRYDVDIITTCSKGFVTYDNVYPEGTEVINGVNVMRYKVVENDVDCSKPNEDKDDEEWIRGVGPYCPAIIEYVKNNAKKYKAIIFITYANYLTVKCMELGLDNVILMPTGHDEPLIYHRIYRRMFNSCKNFLYNSIEEKEFLIRMFDIGNRNSALNCVGIDIPKVDEGFAPDQRQYGNYIVYVGRISNAKNFKEMNKFFIEYKKHNPSDLKLVIIGNADAPINIIYSDDIIFTGFISEEEKNYVLRNSKLLVMPSKFESLSRVILESMALKRPVLVNGNCAVLKGQCIRSNAGLYYENYFEFEAALNYMLEHEDECEQMSENGYRFVREVYDWNVILDNVSDLIESI